MRPHWEHWAPYVFALCAGAVALALTVPVEPLLPPIASNVLATAGSLLHGRGFEIEPGSPFTTRPPLQPLLLAGLGGLGFAPRLALHLHGALTFSASLMGLAVLCRSAALPCTWALLVFGALFAPSHFLLRTHFPDALLTAASLCAVASLARHSRSPSAAGLVAAVAATLVAVATSYLALFTVLPLAAAGLLLAPGRSRGRRLKELLFLGAATGLPLLAWMLRNLRLTGYLSGMSRNATRGQLSRLGFADHVNDLWKTASVDCFDPAAMGIPPVTRELTLSEPAALAGIAAMGALGVILAVGAKALRDHLKAVLRERSRRGWAWIYVSSYALLYASALLSLWTFANNDHLQTRYVAPLYPFLLVTGGLLAAALWEEGAPRALRGLVLALLLAVAAVQIPKTRALLGPAPGPELVPSWYHLRVPDRWAPRNEWSASRRPTEPASLPGGPGPRR